MKEKTLVEKAHLAGREIGSKDACGKNVMALINAMTKDEEYWAVGSAFFKGIGEGIAESSPGPWNKKIVITQDAKTDIWDKCIVGRPDVKWGAVIDNPPF